MVKVELIRKVSEETGKSQKDVKEILEKVEEVIKNTIVENKEEVKLNGFMMLKPEFKASRLVRNPKTNEKIMSKEHYVVKVKPAGKWF